MTYIINLSEGVTVIRGTSNLYHNDRQTEQQQTQWTASDLSHVSRPDNSCEKTIQRHCRRNLRNVRTSCRSLTKFLFCFAGDIWRYVDWV